MADTALCAQCESGGALARIVLLKALKAHFRNHMSRLGLLVGCALSKSRLRLTNLRM